MTPCAQDSSAEASREARPGAGSAPDACRNSRTVSAKISKLRRAISVLELVAQSGGTAAVLWHNNRFAPADGRGWDRVYDRLLAWVRSHGGELVACEDVG